MLSNKGMKKPGLIATAVMAGVVTLAGCSAPEAVETTQVPGQPAPVKNVIMMIGDGMGPQQMGLLETYARYAPHSVYNGESTAMTKLVNDGVLGMSLHSPKTAIVVDSACSATQLAAGVYSDSEMIGLDAQGNKVETILEKAKSMGKATGLVSDTRLTHATPAAFAAHQAHRSMENEIAVDMLSNQVDVMLSGGLRHWIPKSVNDKGASYSALMDQTGGHVKIKSKRKDERNLLTEAQQQGYALAFDRMQLDKAEGDKLLGLFSDSGMDNGIVYTQTKNDPNRSQPTLKEMTKKALDVLAKDPDGFFLMIEGGQIDWAGHNNDAGTMLHEMLKFDETVDYVYEWVKERNDTLLLVTADHETGSFGFSYSRSELPNPKMLPGDAFKEREFAPNFNFGEFGILDRLYGQKKSFGDIFAEFGALENQTPEALVKIVNRYSEFKIDLEQAKDILAMEENEYRVHGHSYLDEAHFPQVHDFKSFYVYGEEIRMDLLGRALSEDQNTVWGTGTHTSTPVGVIAYGPQATTQAFSSLMHHTDVGQKAMQALGAQ
ncbi:alkaline phosphatase [Photobacterium sp. MCCC 1A19761]